MTILSNLYVEKVASEHPIAVWMLNETVDYISYLTETDRQFENASEWALTTCTASEETPPLDVPIANTHVSRISGKAAANITNVSGSGTVVTYTAANTFSAGDVVNISGVSPSVYNLTNATIVSATSTQFTVSDTATGAYSSGGSVSPIVQALSVSTIPISSFSANLSNFAIGFHLYVDTSYATSISFGYQYYDSTILSTVDVVETTTLSTADNQSWKFFSNTFENPPSYATNVKVLISINTDAGGNTGDYDFLVNGLSMGQWSEEFNRYSIGVIPELISSTTTTSNIDLPGTLKFIEAVPYGTSSIKGYYLSKEELYANNYGIPLVFGSSNVTKIYPNVQSSTPYPSLIFPGYGFLNEKGRFNEYTVEIWIRINTDSIEPHRIFGPIGSNDGLYVEGGFLTFVLGNKYGSHFIGEWMRPSLIHIRYIKDSVSVFINGEQVISFDFQLEDLELPTEYNGVKNQDWLGFYASDDVHLIDIDSIAIYSYPVPLQVAKRRFVWGQGVVPPEQTNSSLNANTAFVDYGFAEYANNYNYPDFANWKQAFFSNVTPSNNFLELPQYSLPTFNLDEKTQQNWYDDMQTAEALEQYLYFTFRPDAGWNNETCSIYFEELGILGQKVETIYGIFESDGSASNEILFRLNDTLTNNYFICKINGTTLTYTVNIGGTNTTIATKTVNANERFIAGLNFTNLSDYPLNGINSFSQNQDKVNLYLGGDGSTTFTGKIYRFGFEAKYNNRKISRIYDEDGIFRISDTATITGATEGSNKVTYTADHNFIIGDVISITGVTSTPSNAFNLTDVTVTNVTDTTFSVSATVTGTYSSGGTAAVTQEDRATTMVGHTANYTLKPISKYGLFFADIGVAGYWEDYMPLSYFGKYIKDYLGEEHYDLDLLQFNLDYPEPLETTSIEYTDNWTYQDLFNEYNDPVVLTYADLDNSLYTGWDDYEDMAQQSIKYYYYNTANSALRSYISFQKITNGANKNLVDFVNYETPKVKGVVDPAFLTTDWENTAYEVVDGTIIYPPTTNQYNKPVDFSDLAIVYHLDFNSEGILHHPVTVRDLQLASQVLERQQFTEIGTKFGLPVYPYYIQDLTTNLKGKNPVSIYKGSTPHLYLNRHSGWRIRGDFDPIIDRGISIPVNTNASNNVDISAIQMWLRYSDREFPTGDTEIFYIEYAGDNRITFYMIGDSSTQRGKIFAKDQNGNLVTDIQYYINGIFVDTPYLINEEWMVLGVAFPSLLPFDLYTGRINLNGPLTYNNISYYLATNLSKEQKIQVNTWGQIAEQTWSYWNNDFTWIEVQGTASEDIYAIDPSGIYDKYVGTTRIVVDDSTKGILVDPDLFKVFGQTEWQTSTKLAV